MPRTPRKLSYTNIYHIMTRGINKTDIFLDDEDKTFYLDILKEINKKKTFSIYAYCLMRNHVHLLLNTKDQPISHIMKSINIRYSYYFNKKYQRIGHFFQDRFKSEPVENEQYLLTAAVYIHNNPVKAEMAGSPHEYKWSSYNAYIQSSQGIAPLVDPEPVLRIFSKDKAIAIEKFIEYSLALNHQFKEETLTFFQKAEQFVDGFLKMNHIFIKDDLKRNLIARDKLIKELKSNSSLSIREIANLLDIGRNIIQRVR